MPVTANWTATRRLLVVAGLATWLPRGFALEEAYSESGVVVASGELPLPHWFTFSFGEAGLVWGVLVAALVGMWWRPSRVLAALVFVTGVLLVYTECLNEKAYDRLFLFQALTLVWAGAGGGAAGRHARIAQILVFAGIYGSTGWSKLLFEPAWIDGTVLANHLVDGDFGLRPLGLLPLPGWVLALSGWGTLLFEAGFPFFIWFRRLRPPLLLLGVAFHLGILATMHVNTFSLIALAGYPAMSSAEEWQWLQGRVRRARGVLGAALLVAVGAAATPWLVGLVLGPDPGAAWTPPDLALRAAVQRHLDAVTTGDPGAIVEERWGGAQVTRGTGVRTVSLLAAADVPGVDARTGLVVLLTLADVLPGELPTTVHLRVGTPADFGDVRGDAFWIGPVGHRAPFGGGQIWPGGWGWVLPNRGTFIGFAGGVPPGWRAGSPVDTMRLPGTWGPPGLPDGTVVVTDTGTWRSPGRRGDTVDAVDVDQVARVAAGFAAWLAAPNP